MKKYSTSLQRSSLKRRQSNKLFLERKLTIPTEEVEPAQSPKAKEADFSRANIVDLFFESMYDDLIVQKTIIKPICACGNESSASSGPSGSFSFQSRSQEANEEKRLNEAGLLSGCLGYEKLVFKNGNMYEGQVDGPLMHGKGTFYWSDGSIYKGNFEHGYPHGQGQLTIPDMSVYEGEFRLGFLHGIGSLNIKSTPMIYRGEWKYSERDGTGWSMYDTNNWYEGGWKHNKKNGEGLRHYPNGAQYSGSWRDHVIHGEGSMLWPNNDYYTGKWQDGYQHGYGEYTWNLMAHNSFVFPNYNCYKGNWVAGKRTGAGIMNFGHESGARFAGTWLDNKKDGPGIMVCGNGLVLGKNPLFENDKPSSLLQSDALPKPASGDEKAEFEIYRDISKCVSSKENLDELPGQVVEDLAKSGRRIKMGQYAKLLEKGTDQVAVLKIPLHHVTEDVNLDFFACNDWEITETGAIDLQNSLKNLIINNLPQLRSIYNQYASLCAEEELSFEPTLIRLFLWQLFRDIGLTNKGGVSIVEIDEMIGRNPNSCFDTTYSPWEPIYFWQFLQALVGVASLLYSSATAPDSPPSICEKFKNFLNQWLLPNASQTQGNCLRQWRDLAPIRAIYNLYKEVGEPHTLEKFMDSMGLKKGQAIPCYKAYFHENKRDYKVPIGANVVIFNNLPCYSEISHRMVSIENNPQVAYEGLFAFSCLRRSAILKLLGKVCPQIVLPTGRYDLFYRLSFIEFYEALVMLAQKKVEQDISKTRLAPIQTSAKSHSHIKKKKRQ